MVFRIYVERRAGFQSEAGALLADCRELLGLTGINKIRVINRYDAEGMDKKLFDACISKVFGRRDKKH